MDPASAFGISSGAVQVLHFIGHILKGLKELGEKLQNADLTIRSLMLELFTIKTAIIQLDDWSTYNSDTSSTGNKDFHRDLGVALEGCRAIMETLREEVLFLTRNIKGESSTMGFMTRARVVWDEDLMKSRQEMLHSQVLALQLLLQVCHCRSSSQQTELLQKAENRRIMKKVADDTISIRSRNSPAVSRRTDDVSSRRTTPSFHNGTTFEFDESLVDSVPYRRAKEHFRSSKLEPTNHDPITHIDKDYLNTPSSFNSVQHFIAQGNPPSSSTASLTPHDSVDPAPKHSKSVSLIKDSSHPTQHFRRWHSTPSSGTFQHASGSRRQKVRSSLRRLGSSISISNGTSTKIRGDKPPGTQGISSSPLPTKGTTRGCRGDLKVSIDPLSSEEASVPTIVKASQLGSPFEVEELIKIGHNIETRHVPSRRNALLVAAHCGNASIVEVLLQNNATLNVADRSGSTALHLAASRGHFDVLELLIAENMDTEAVDLHGRTPLLVAADNGEVRAMQLLLLADAKVNARTSDQMTALHVAARRGDEEMAELLISHRADLEAKDSEVMTALHYACECAHLGVIRLLVHYKASIDAAGFDRRTPLICAAAMGKHSVSQFLLNKKASPVRTDDGGMTALHWAAFNGHTEVVDLLSSKKGSLRMTNTVGRVPLHLAVMNSQYAVVDLILRKMTSTDIRCSSGLTPLHYACLADMIGIARLLLMSGPDIEAQTNEQQQRPIHLAAARNSMKLLNLLCDKGASLDARDSMGDRALCTACRYGHAGSVQLLLDRGSPLHLKFETTQQYDSPLCLAAKEGHLSVVSLLLHRGASVLVKDNVGWQPIHYAAFYGHPEILQLLLTFVPSSTRADSKVDLPTEHMGFASNAYISEERKREIRRILSRAYHGDVSGVNGRNLIHDENAFTTTATNMMPAYQAGTLPPRPCYPSDTAARPTTLYTVSELAELVPTDTTSQSAPAPQTTWNAPGNLPNVDGDSQASFSLNDRTPKPSLVPTGTKQSTPPPQATWHAAPSNLHNAEGDLQVSVPSKGITPETSDMERPRIISIPNISCHPSLVRTSPSPQELPPSHEKVQAWHLPQADETKGALVSTAAGSTGPELAATSSTLQSSSTPSNSNTEHGTGDLDMPQSNAVERSTIASVYTAPKGGSSEEVDSLIVGTAHKSPA